MDNDQVVCKSKAHQQYRDGLEAVYIQAFIASRDLAKLIEEARTAAGATGGLSPQGYDHFRRDGIDAVIERLQFGQREFAAAERAVNAHFDRGCKLVEAGLAEVAR